MRIAIVYFADPLAPRTGMDLIRWYELARELRRLGHFVDMISPVAPNSEIAPGFGIRNVANVLDWNVYDVVKTRSHTDILFVPEHQFIISRIGRVVDQERPSHQWALRDERIRCQGLVHSRAKAVVFTCKENIPRWRNLYSNGPECLVIPTGCPSQIPEPTRNPFQTQRNVLFCGSLTSSRFVERLNKLGRALEKINAKLHFLGRNQLDTYRETEEDIDPQWVNSVGCLTEHDTWTYLYHADVGVTFARSTDVYDSDSSKLYYYLRAGLPAISEEHVASSYLLHETGYGAIAAYGDIDHMVQSIAAWIGRKDKAAQVQDFMVREHSWTVRAGALNDYIMSRRR